MKMGLLNKISDVKGVTVGHRTLIDGDIQTGVTIIMPTPDNPFFNKLPAAQYVINGFGKTTGLIQIEELGQLESPIGLTNTLSVGRVQDALVGYMVTRCQAENYALKSINVVVGECNDSRINDIAQRSLCEADVRAAIADASADFAVGAVGAGRGMVCYGLKGGIGSASRVVEIDGQIYTLGALVLANHGRLSQLVVDGEPVGAKIIAARRQTELPAVEWGSIVVVLACDAPVDARQLKRLCKRATAGIARTGSEFGNGSGDVVIAFSTAQSIPHDCSAATVDCRRLLDGRLDSLFSAVVEAVEDSVINALQAAEAVGGFDDLATVMTNCGLKK